jgi:uncharacterized protein YifE (UPF0438 family)
VKNEDYTPEMKELLGRIGEALRNVDRAHRLGYTEKEREYLAVAKDCREQLKQLQLAAGFTEED